MLSLTPHMHYRGKDFKFTATWPDGTSKELLKVSKYDFNWQTAYDFEQPLALPAGSRIDCVAHWDNSPANPANPDASKDVAWGQNSTDEMMIGFVDYTVKDGVSPKPISPLIGKLHDLAEHYPGQVWRVDVSIQPGKAPEPTAVHLPREGNGGWYVAFGTLVLPAPIHDIVWDGNKVTAKAEIPNQGTMEMSGVVLESGDIDLTMGGGTIRGVAADKSREDLDPDRLTKRDPPVRAQMGRRQRARRRQQPQHRREPRRRFAGQDHVVEETESGRLPRAVGRLGRRHLGGERSDVVDSDPRLRPRRDVVSAELASAEHEVAEHVAAGADETQLRHVGVVEQSDQLGHPLDGARSFDRIA